MIELCDVGKCFTSKPIISKISLGFLIIYQYSIDYHATVFWQPLLNDLKRVLAADVAIVAGSNKLVPTSSLKYIFITNRIDFMI